MASGPAGQGGAPTLTSPSPACPLVGLALVLLQVEQRTPHSAGHTALCQGQRSAQQGSRSNPRVRLRCPCVSQLRPLAGSHPGRGGPCGLPPPHMEPGLLRRAPGPVFSHLVQGAAQLHHAVQTGCMQQCPVGLSDRSWSHVGEDRSTELQGCPHLQEPGLHPRLLDSPEGSVWSP